jgi:uncharacterized protein
MTEIEVHEYKKKDVSNAMVLVSFPTVGLISTIVSNFLVSNLKLERIGAFISNDFFPAAVIENGVPTPPVRIFAGDNVCGPDGSCNQLVVMGSELPIGSNALSALADKILHWCRENNCNIITTIEGINSQSSAEETPKTYYVGSNGTANEYLKGLSSSSVEPLNAGMVGGLSGLLLYKGNIQDFTVSCLLAEAHIHYPDSRSAAQVLKVLDRMVPQIKMDPEPLLKQAEEIEEQIKKSMSQIQQVKRDDVSGPSAAMFR